MSDECYNCGKEYEHLGMHWRRGSCPYPEISPRQHELIEGCLMGDGHLDFANKSPKLHVSNTNRKFLEWLEEELSELVSRIYLHGGAEKQSEVFKKHGMGEWKCSDVYRLSTRTLPAFEQYEHWYREDGVRFPDDLTLSPISLKVWYCSDGTVRDDGTIQIGSKNEMHRPGFLKSLFEPFGVEPTITQWNMSFTIDESETLFNVMGEPVPGMEGKWP